MSIDLEGASPRRALPAKLRPGSRIDFYGGLHRLEQRVLLSSGTRSASDDGDLAHAYSDAAFIPCRPWRRLFADELAAEREPEKQQKEAK